MASAAGYIAIKVPKNVFSEIHAYGLTSTTTRLFQDACGTKFPNKVSLFEGEAEMVAGFMILRPRRTQWMNVAEHIVLHGSSVELYGKITSQYGQISFYALTADETRYVYKFDQTCGEPIDSSYEEAKALVLLLTPSELLCGFPKLI